jgi:hypothetical protein
MAKQQTAKSTIAKDPFETLIPDRISAKAEVIQHPATAGQGEARRQKKEKITVHLTHDLIERLKNAAYWNPDLTIAGIAEVGVAFAIEQVEKEHGGPYPQRKRELKGGRPIGS